MGKWIAVAVMFFGLMTCVSSSAELHTAGQLSVHVVDSEGATIQGASVFVHKHSPSEDSVRLMARTDIHGDFVLKLPAGGYDVLVTSPGFAARVETISISPGKMKKVQWKLKALNCDFPGMNCDTFQ